MWNCADAETSVHVCFPWADMAENDAMQLAKRIEDHCRNNLVNHQSPITLYTFALIFFSPSRLIFKPRLDFQLQGKRFYKFWLNCNDVTRTHHTPKRSEKRFSKVESSPNGLVWLGIWKGNNSPDKMLNSMHMKGFPPQLSLSLFVWYTYGVLMDPYGSRSKVSPIPSMGSMGGTISVAPRLGIFLHYSLLLCHIYLGKRDGFILFHIYSFVYNCKVEV